MASFKTGKQPKASFTVKERHGIIHFVRTRTHNVSTKRKLHRKKTHSLTWLDVPEKSLGSLTRARFFVTAVVCSVDGQPRRIAHKRAARRTPWESCAPKIYNATVTKARPTNIRRTNLKGPEEPSSATNVIDTMKDNSLQSNYLTRISERGIKEEHGKRQEEKKRERMTRR